MSSKQFVVASAAALAASALVGNVEGHICVFHPVQRGDALPEELIPGNSLCFRRTPYCGGVALPDKVTHPDTNTFVAGAEAQILFQQNLNHFWEASPGSLDVAISYDLNPPQDDDDADVWQTLLTLDDFAPNDMVTQTNFSATVMFPNKAADHALLRFRYVSHNVAEIDPANNTESIFYNCADVRIVANPSLEEDDVAVEKDDDSTTAVDDATAATGCKTPDAWGAEAIETTNRGIVHHRIVYGGKQQIVRWDRFGPLKVEGRDEELTTFSFYNETIPGQPNYTKPEYIVEKDGHSANTTCTLYGADPMYLWEFGKSRNEFLSREYEEEQPTLGDHPTPSAQMQEWITTDMAHRYLVRVERDGVCVPILEQHPESTLVFTRVEEFEGGRVPDEMFELPSICKKPVLGHGLH